MDRQLGRHGNGVQAGPRELRHLDCQTLWVQQRLRRRDFELRKVLGTENPADLFTKHMDSAAKLDGLVKLYGCEFREGRAAAAPSLKKQHQSQGVDEKALMACLPHTRHAREIETRYPRAQPDEELREDDEQEDLQEAANTAPERSSRLSGRQRARGAPGVGECKTQAGSAVRTDQTQGDVAADQERAPLRGGSCKQLHQWTDPRVGPPPGEVKMLDDIKMDRPSGWSTGGSSWTDPRVGPLAAARRGGRTGRDVQTRVTGAYSWSSQGHTSASADPLQFNR